MRARYYSPALRRFINADIIPGEISNAVTLNRYAYANGNPVSNVDPFGLVAVEIYDEDGEFFDDDDGKLRGGGANNAKTPARNAKSAESKTASKKTAKSNSSTKVHGNSSKSTKVQHQYDIIDNTMEPPKNIVKTGISGRTLNKNGTSPRANQQVNAFNRTAGFEKYSAKIVKTGIPTRYEALKLERERTNKIHKEGHPLTIHRYPKPED